MWHWILYTVASMSADQQLIEQERARTAGAVNVAYASLATEPAPAPKQEPVVPAACPCGGKGYIVRPDGSRWACQCKTCPTGKCRQR